METHLYRISFYALALQIPFTGCQVWSGRTWVVCTEPWPQHSDCTPDALHLTSFLFLFQYFLSICSVLFHLKYSNITTVTKYVITLYSTAQYFTNRIVLPLEAYFHISICILSLWLGWQMWCTFMSFFVLQASYLTVLWCPHADTTILLVWLFVLHPLRLQSLYTPLISTRCSVKTLMCWIGVKHIIYSTHFV